MQLTVNVKVQIDKIFNLREFSIQTWKAAGLPRFFVRQFIFQLCHVAISIVAI